MIFLKNFKSLLILNNLINLFNFIHFTNGRVLKNGNFFTFMFLVFRFAEMKRPVPLWRSLAKVPTPFDVWVSPRGGEFEESRGVNHIWLMNGLRTRKTWQTPWINRKGIEENIWGLDRP